MTFLNERPRHQLDQMNRHNRHMTTTENGDPSLAFVLQQSEFLRKRVNPIKSRQIQ